MIRVLFVCLGNICRSPTAEGIFRNLLHEQGLTTAIEVDSAGTSDWHIGQPPDTRAQAMALSRDIDLSALQGRQVTTADFHHFNYIIAMDSANHRKLLALCPRDAESRLRMCLTFAPETGLTDVPDPYYDDGFERVFDMLTRTSQGLLAEIRQIHGL